MKRLLLALALPFGLANHAVAQSTATPTVPGVLQTGTGCVHGETTCYIPGTPLSPLPVFDTTFSAVGSPGTLSATTASSNIALPANGSEVEIANGGSVPVFVNLGVGSGTTASVLTSMQIPKGQTAFLPVGSNTFIAGITGSSTASVTVTVGILAPGGSGGGGGGGGGVVTGNQSNAGVGTTGSANVGVNAYKYVWNGSSWVQDTGAVTAAAIAPTVPTTTLATGGVAQSIAVTHGGWICNPLSAADQGLVTAEVIYVNIVTTATAVGNAGNSNITAGQCFNVPAGFSGNVSWIAATTGHKLNATVY